MLKPATSKSDTYQAPSWSLASVDGHLIVFLDVTIRSTLVDVLELCVKTVHGDGFGQVTGGPSSLLSAIDDN